MTARSQGGMTLLELVVGMTIIGMALSVGYAALSTIVDHRGRVEEITDRLGRAAAQRRSLIAWLSGARLTIDPGGPSFRGLDGYFEDHPDDELTFLTSADTPLGASETVVRLFVDRDEETLEQGLTAEFSERTGTRSQVIEIEPTVIGLDVAYFSRVMAGREWLPSWVSNTLLPRGLEVQLTADVADTLPPLLALPIRVAMGGAQ